MNCPKCQSEHTSKFGKDRNGNQRYKCLDCKKTFGETDKPLGVMRIGMDKAVFALRLLLEGMSVRATERLTGLHRDTLCDLVLHVGQNCARFLKATIRDVPVKEVECDELWGFVAMKEKTRMLLKRPQETSGDAYCYIAMERNTKLVLTWHCGKRDSIQTWEFIDNLRFAAAGRFQISTDGYKPYTSAVPLVFQFEVDFAQLVKRFGGSTDMQPDTRYSPAQITSIDKTRGCGNPDWDRVCTSHSERLNLSVRMACRRMTRLTNGHSKSWEHHEAMLGLFFAWYNWVRKHQTIKTTPAVASGIATEPWTLERLLTEAAKCR